MLAQAGLSLVPPLRAATYQTLLGLLASSGRRIGEAIKLDRGDIDWHDGVLLIRESKFHKSRLAPLHTSSLETLHTYQNVRDRLQPSPLEPSFFVSLKRKRLLYPVVGQTFRRLVDDVGSGSGLHRRRACTTFATASRSAPLIGWYRSGQDVQARLPALSTYLGHREPAHTHWYLSASRSCLLSPQHGRTAHGWRPGHDPHRPDPAGILHRSARPSNVRSARERSRPTATP